MKPRLLSQLAQELGLAAHDDKATTIERVSIDSRNVQPGDLFVAVTGESFDGNAFVEDAIARGASAVVTSRTDVTGMARLVTDDTLRVLRDIAAIARGELTIPVIAITGSSGKTSTKDLLAGALPNAWVSPRSFNNEVGVPLTILGTPADADYLVAEVGSRGRGHIEYLMPAVQPDVSVITNLGVVHLETFGTTDDLADAKHELVEGLNPSGFAVVPEGEPRLHRDRPNTLTFGTEEQADVCVSDIELDDQGYPSFRLRSVYGTIAMKLSVAGAHQSLNAAAAACAVLPLGIDPATIAEGMQSATGSQWRMEIHRGRFTVVNDAYNANPDSVEAAMTTVAAMPGRHIAVLGTMAELGPIEVSEHERIGRMAADLGFASIVTVGDEPGIARAAGPIACNVANAEEAYDLVTRLVDDGDVILVKASREVGLERLALRLAEEAAE